MFLLLITSRIAIRLFSFNKILLFIKKLAFDGFYPPLECFKKNRFLLLFEKEKKNEKRYASEPSFDIDCLRNLIAIRTGRISDLPVQSR